MLTILQRRIVRDIVLVFFTSLLVITLLVMLIGVAREALNQGLGLMSILRLIPYTLPNALSMAVPGTALFSVCSVYGRMSADNEFVALQSVGISFLPSIMPAIVLTIVLSVATVGLINVAFTWGFHGIERVVMSSIENIAYKVLERERSFQHSAVQSRQRLNRLETEMQRRWASGFTCLAMSMIGVPLAIRMKPSDTMTTFGIVFLPTVLVYYPIFALTLDMAKDGRIASEGVWIANVIFISAAVLLLRRLVYRPV